jgi:hypothetical protein
MSLPSRSRNFSRALSLAELASLQKPQNAETQARGFTPTRPLIALEPRFYEDQRMRIRENRPTIDDSLSTTLEVAGREQMIRHIFDTLGKKGVVVTDEMVHLSHYGFDDRTGWDEHIIVVERFGVFGFTDGPCLTGAAPASSPTATTADEFSAEVESAYGQTG